jgi:hypothetical protein
MNQPTCKSIAELLADDALITAAITRGVRLAVLEHARAGRPVATCRDGKVVWISPQEILAQFAGAAETGRKPADEQPAPTNGPSS